MGRKKKNRILPRIIDELGNDITVLVNDFEPVEGTFSNPLLEYVESTLSSLLAEIYTRHRTGLGAYRTDALTLREIVSELQVLAESIRRSCGGRGNHGVVVERTIELAYLQDIEVAVASFELAEAGDRWWIKGFMA